MHKRDRVNDLTFEEWMNIVDEAIKKLADVSYDDLPDWLKVYLL
jgi:hypothetical protein